MTSTAKGVAKKNEPATDVAYPAWFRTVISTFEAAESHMFILHGGIDDYVTLGHSVHKYLTSALCGPFEVVLTFSVDQGITFAQPHMRTKFFAALGQPEPKADEALYFAPTPGIALILEFLKKSARMTAAAIIDRVDNMVGTEVPVDSNLIELCAMLHRAGTDAQLEARANPLIMTSPNLSRLREDVRDMGSGIRPIEVPHPNYDARLAFARERLDQEPSVALSGVTPEQLASLTAGLYRRHVETIILRAAATDNGKLTRNLAREVQREMMDLEYGSVMQRIDNDYRLTDVGGHVEPKAFFEKRVVKALRNGEFDITPQNVLLVGPSGTGKTLLANAVANESGINCLLVDLSQFLEGVVGGTEAKLAKWKEGVIASAPCIVILDEIDQKMRRGAGGADPGGGGSVENRLFSFMLEFFGDPENKRRGIVGLFMSNRPGQLDDALLSRCEAIIPMLPPEDDAARALVLGAIMRRAGLKVEDTAPWLLEQAARVVDWSGRDLEQVVTEALALARLDGMTVQEAVTEAITYRRPATKDVREQVEQALRACNNLKLLPAKYRELVNSRAETEPDETVRKSRRIMVEPQYGKD